MAIQRTETVPNLMKDTTGAQFLITDPRADRILAERERHGSERYSKWCGGKGGWDDYAERLH
jgi:hypothetical protein